MAHDYTKSKKIALNTIVLLGIITVVEVVIALVGKGYLIEGIELPVWLMGIAMIGLSVFKAYKIVFEFMHLGHEIGGLAFTVMLPTLLLVWGVIAFLYEGSYWKNSRKDLDDKNKMEIQDVKKKQGMMLPDQETIYLF